MAIKLLMSWDIIQGREQEYFEFVVREFIPEIQRLGLEPTDAWVTVFGDQPQILTAVEVPDQESLQIALMSAEWDDLIAELDDFVENLEFKTVISKPGFQM